MWSPPLGMWPRVVKVCARDRKGSVGNHTTSAPPADRCERKTPVCPHTAHTCLAFDSAHADPFLGPRLAAEPDKYGHPNRQIPDTTARSRDFIREIFLSTSRWQIHTVRHKERLPNGSSIREPWAKRARNSYCCEELVGLSVGDDSEPPVPSSALGRTRGTITSSLG